MGGKHFVFVHGSNTGAWCWFKMIDMLEKAGHKGTAVDLVSAGVSPVNADDVSSFDQYNKPLYDIFETLGDSEKVILVGHSMGGITVARATERYPDKIAGAVYIAACMWTSGMSPKDDEAFQNVVPTLHFGYGKGSDKEPTSWWFKQEVLKEAFSTCSSEDTQLAMLLVRPTPMIHDNATTFTQDGYDSVPRVYIRTLQDKITPTQIQDEYISRNPPKHVRNLDCDHSPFFSAAKELRQLLLDFAATTAS